MALVIKDRVKVTSTTTGTGTYTLGSAVAGFQDFATIGDGNTTYYSATNGTDWEIGIGTYATSGTTLARTTILESSNSNAAVDWSAGDKEIFVTLPVEATQGTVPTADNSSVGTNLYAWTNLQKQLNAGAINGVPYNNNNVTGIVSTFAALAAGYWGGVLAPNGDIHFVPYISGVGQKLSAAGVVSTYSLVYTLSVGYQGGVLAPNGDIHFIPNSAARGQKISASGVVSTYSLIVTGSSAYQGGVLAPNGDIHFVPHNATVGQKVSAAGVVSTYSLVYSPGRAFGGVLAPNGDIHFVPNQSAAVGQKVSAAGVVSTYSLVYTSSNSAYQGGVIAPNGDIHFVPASANRGQKVSSAGVVSTYSLVYTAGTAYSGGVLAPNGEIHFSPNSGTVGQKISVAGVVSTYSRVASGQLTGAVLSMDGSIVFASVGTANLPKLSTGVPAPIGYALNPYFNKF